ncbi:major intrinsic protein (MIP) family transporter [Trifolium pratense]|uniref:Major intrinsic protein (MIP) family transporter n=1 Tax=Trifolium pratense TaxID=57577 RepID=A0A2K3NPT2_TRIPR|nr:major intrinsic protein (MIP) family transporter [Trifolium pratense]
MSVQSNDKNGLGPKKPLKGKFQASIGADEFFSAETWKAALTELVATASLMVTLSTSIIACLDSHEVDPKLIIPFAVFINAFLFLMATVPLSGGHMSPVFTCIAALKGVVTLYRALLYVIAQCIGSIIGVTLAFDKKRSKNMGLPMVCLVIAGAMALAVFVSITITGRPGYAGVGLNPARCLGAALLHGGSLWYGHWVFWVGSIIACLIYYSVSINLPNEGSISDDGEYVVLKLARGSLDTIRHGDISNDVTIERSDFQEYLSCTT